jgi:hypothetical protein
MPLSVVEGHEEGAVAGFEWMQTPQVILKPRNQPKLKPSESNIPSSKADSMQVTPPNDETITIRSAGRGDVESVLFDNKDKEKDDEKSDPSASDIWQHILSVGRDGRCILQSFTRGKLITWYLHLTST